MIFYEQMVPALSALLEEGETLKASVYGTLLQKRSYTFGYLLEEDCICIKKMNSNFVEVIGYHVYSW